MSIPPAEMITTIVILNRIVLDALVMKGVLSYSDIQESISVVRENIPPEQYTPLIAQVLNIMEQTWQAGPYQSSLLRPGEPNN
jgi:hypothetical protein